MITLLLAGCGGGASSATSGTTPGTADGAAYMGLYRGDWGAMVLRQVGDEVWGSYDHDGGAVRGTLSGDVFSGRWCEDPTRTDDSDSGYVRFIFTTHPDGSITIDGSWSYGSAAPDHDDWDLAHQPGERDPALEEWFTDPSHFCP
ncbi:MAG: hypothetical protein KC593_20865 [Myxococcales bacterium]|nr:hypothetical protein [Myxococcales bacterium]MCB9627993.1 hypothetical protein [Sandaracinaceae bacterium]